jgi:hypothetical protein
MPGYETGVEEEVLWAMADTHLVYMARPGVFVSSRSPKATTLEIWLLVSAR